MKASQTQKCSENQDGLLILFLMGYSDSPAHLNRPCSRKICILKLSIEA